MAGITRIVRREVKSAMAVTEEVKFLDFSSGTTSVLSGTPYGVCVSLMPQGTDFFQRLGQVVKGKRLTVRLLLTLNGVSLTAGTAQAVRVLVVRDRMWSGASFLLANTLGTALFNLAPPVLLTTPRSPLSLERYDVMKDHTYYVGQAAATTKRLIQFSLPVNTKSNYLDANANTASIGPGNIAVILITDDATNGMTFSFTSRFSYTDSS